MRLIIRNISGFAFILTVLFLNSACSSHSSNDYSKELGVITDIKEYHELIREDSSHLLVDLESFIPGITLDIRYATTNNFTHEIIYKSPKAFVRKPVANALLNIQNELKEQGLAIKIFDAYRPYAATVKFYEVYLDTNFVAAPWKGSVHNRGCAVDLTLIDLSTGNELEMPTPFDDFTKKASHSYNNLNEAALKNREVLLNIMLKNGFSKYEHEWWHYNFNGWQSYQLMDIPFETLNN